MGPKVLPRTGTFSAESFVFNYHSLLSPRDPFVLTLVVSIFFSLFFSFSKQYILLRKVLSPIHDVKGEIILIITREGLYSTRKVVKLIEMKFKMSNKN